MTIRGVIFDLDGTLVDSGLNFDAMRVEMELPAGSSILEALDTMSEPRASRCRAILAEHEQLGVERARLMHGVTELLAALYARQIPTAILTRNSRQSALATLARLNLSFELVLAREDAPAKPDPAAIWMICRAWQLEPREVAIVGDYKFDLQAGRRAGSRTVLYTAGRELRHLPWTAEADVWLECFTRSEPLLALLAER